jgi:hypothetical protein
MVVLGTCAFLLLLLAAGRMLQSLQGRVLLLLMVAGRVLQALQGELLQRLQVEVSLQVPAASTHLPFPTLWLPAAVWGWVRWAKEAAQGHLLSPSPLLPPDSLLSSFSPSSLFPLWFLSSVSLVPYL